MRRSFEAGGTTLWGADFNDTNSSDSEMSSLAPIREDEDGRGDHRSSQYLDAVSTESTSASPSTNLRRRQSEFRTTLLKHQALWRKAAKQANQGGLDHRRKSILPIDDITDIAPVDDEDDEFTTDENGAQPFNTVRHSLAPDAFLQAPHHHPKVQPVTSLDIERNVKPQLRQSRKFLGFIFPRLPTRFATKLDEFNYKRYYSGKKKNSILVINVLYIMALLALWITKILPMPPSSNAIAIKYVIRESILCLLLVILHAVACVLAKKAQSYKEVLNSAVLTWAILFVETQISTITSYLDFAQVKQYADFTWNQTGTWQTILAIFTTYNFLSVIPLQFIIALSLALVFFHLLTMGILTSIYNTTCLTRVSSVCLHLLHSPFLVCY